MEYLVYIGWFLFAFIAGFSCDFFYTKWTEMCVKKHAFAASNWSALVYISSLCWTVIIVEEQYYMIVAYILGSYAGTYIAVKRSTLGDI